MLHAFRIFFRSYSFFKWNFTNKCFKNHQDESQKYPLWAWNFSFGPLTWNWPTSSVVYCNIQWCTILRCTIPWLCTSIKGPVQGKGNKRYGINMTSWPWTRCLPLIHSSGFWTKDQCKKITPYVSLRKNMWWDGNFFSRPNKARGCSTTPTELD